MNWVSEQREAERQDSQQREAESRILVVRPDSLHQLDYREIGNVACRDASESPASPVRSMPGSKIGILELGRCSPFELRKS